MKSIIAYEMDLYDPGMRALQGNGCRLRTYQLEALRNIYDAALSGEGGRFTVMFPRQSGKNETQAQLEAALMAANQHRGGNIVKIIPTEKNQGTISSDRLKSVLCSRFLFDGDGREEPDIRKQNGGSFKRNEIGYGSTKVRCLSSSPNAAIVGATADLLLEVDEAQMVPADKFDREAAPMAASTNAVQVFWGTAWDDRTLLARETRQAEATEQKDCRKHVFVTTAAEVGREVPQYGTFVREQIERFGREHPAIRTQFFCEEITELTSMFTAERISRMKGDHEALFAPEKDRCYVFLIDVAGSDEITPEAKKAGGFSDRRDATVVTICDVRLPENKAYDVKNFVWRVVGRRLYRNMRSDLLEKEICREINFWKPHKIIIDHSGMGAMLTDILMGKYKRKVYPVDITAANKTKMAWEFLAMVDTGRWVEYKGDELNTLRSGFTPGTERYEMLREPALLQQMFFRELRGCRIEPTGNGFNVSWGVKAGTRDNVTGRMLHDDLVMSAAMAVFETGDLPICNVLPEWNPDSWRKREWRLIPTGSWNIDGK